jgi:hypothetical protein
MNDVFQVLKDFIEVSGALTQGFYDLMFTGINLGVFGTYTLFYIMFTPATLFLFMTAVLVKKVV